LFDCVKNIWVCLPAIPNKLRMLRIPLKELYRRFSIDSKDSEN
jgi:hypothetical protein